MLLVFAAAFALVVPFTILTAITGATALPPATPAMASTLTSPSDVALIVTEPIS